MLSLRPYQEEALKSINDFSEKGINKQLVVLPTGAGNCYILTPSSVQKRQSPYACLSTPCRTIISS